ncbi:MAG: alpha/beta fold hydrolase [Lachnospiraceae bacterium]|nr:alpha/beta fold hydrolase [Lachnospiraceae bacterium]
MKKRLSVLLAAVTAASILAGCGNAAATTTTSAEATVEEMTAEATTTAAATEAPATDEKVDYLKISKQGMFSSGGTVTEPVEGEYDPTTNWLDATIAGNTAHVDHANVYYQIPVEDNGNPMVYLHGYGQSRMGWMTTPDGREGWSDIFLKYGHAAFLVDQPRRGAAGSTTSMTADGFLDAWSAESKDYKPGDQAWYTHFRIGRVAPERYEGSQFPEGDEAQDQFFRQMTPNTGNFDMGLAAAALGEVMADVKEMTGNKSIFVTHSQGGAVGWSVPVENISAIVAIEPGGTPQIDSEQYKALLEAKIPIIIYFGDYIDNGPEEIMSTGFWGGIRDGAVAFAEAYNAAGGDCTVVDLPKEGITGNSHFLFQEMNNKEIADHLENWLVEHDLGRQE